MRNVKQVYWKVFKKLTPICEGYLIDAVYGYYHALGVPWCASKELGVLGYPSINLNLTLSTALFPFISHNMHYPN